MAQMGQMIKKAAAPAAAAPSAPAQAPMASAPVAPQAPGPQMSLPAAPAEGTPERIEYEAQLQYARQIGDMILAANPGIDYQTLYGKLAQMAEQEAPTPERPGLVKMIGVAAGPSPELAVPLMQQAIGQRHKAAQDKFEMVMGYREAALKGDIEQKLAEGKFKQALQQSSALLELQNELKRAGSLREHEQAKELEGEKQKGRMALQTARSQAAMERQKERAKTKGAGLGLDEKEILQIQRIAQQAFESRRNRVDPMTGEPIWSDEENMRMYEEDIDEAMQAAARSRGKAPAPQMKTSGFGAWKAAKGTKKE